MMNQPIAPVVPNMSNQAAAVAGSSAAIFTGTDKKIIEELSGGEKAASRTFREIFSKKPLTPEVENEDSTVEPGKNAKEVEGQYRDHIAMLKHAPLYNPQEHVKISKQAHKSNEDEKKKNKTRIDDKYVEEKVNKHTYPGIKGNPKIHQETIAMAKELKFNPGELFDKFSLEQKELFSLMSRIKDLHLKRLLAETREKFDAFSLEIRKETLARAKTEAKSWLESNLNKLTRESAEYKLGILKSMQLLENNPQREENIKWLTEIITNLS